MNASKPLNNYLGLSDSYYRDYTALDLQKLDVACNLWPYLSITFIKLVPNGFENKQKLTIYNMRKKLLENERSLLGMFNRFATDKIIFDYVELYTRERVDFEQKCPLTTQFANSPFKECIIYLALEKLNGQYKFKIGKTKEWRKRNRHYKVMKRQIQLIFAFTSCHIVESVLLHFCSNSIINSDGTDCLVSEWFYNDLCRL
jgi:hypothetical protein